MFLMEDDEETIELEFEDAVTVMAGEWRTSNSFRKLRQDMQIGSRLEWICWIEFRQYTT